MQKREQRRGPALHPNEVSGAGFTLIELLLSIGLIGILSSVVIVAINPLKQLAAAEDVRRRNSANQLERALAQYLVEYDTFPGDSTIPEGAANALPICRTSFAESSGCINFDALVERTRDFLPCFPRDGSETNANRSGYAVYQESGRAFVTALYLGERSGGSSCEKPPLPIAHWRFDEGEGFEAQDSSTSQLHGALTNMVTAGWTTDAAPGFQFGNPYALHFDGVDDSVRWAAAPILGVAGDLTLSVWGNFDALEPGLYKNALFSYGSGGESLETNYRYWLNVESDKTLRYFWEIGNGSDITAASTVAASVNPGEWHHYALVRNSTAKIAYFFVDGVQLGAVVSYGSDPAGGTSDVFWLGEDQSSPGTYNWEGFLDDARIYNTTLTGGQILALARGNP